MALRVCTLDGLNLNDHVTYWLRPGFDPGENEPTFDEWRNYYTNGVAIANLSFAHTVPVFLPITIELADEASVKTAIAAINTKIATCHMATPKNLVVGSATYQIIDSTQIVPVEDEFYMTFQPQLGINLRRLP